MKHSNVAFFIPHRGCPNQCSFCNQKTISGAQNAPSPEEIASACRQALEQVKDPANTEIAFFGGSFTAIPREEMLLYLRAAAPFVGKGRFSGIRVSTRPDAVDREILDLLKEHGVTAVELGAQSMDDTVLELNGRGHTAQDVRSAAELIREYGFSFGLQMMTGLFGEREESAYKTAKELIRLMPDTVRMYPTVVLKGTRLGELFKAGQYAPPGLEETVELCAGLLDLFEEAGIPVIRLGLHASREVEEQFLAGAYHPALRELCEARRYRERMDRALDGLPPGEYEFKVHPRCLSKALGQKRENIEWFAKRGYTILVTPAQGIDPLNVKIAGRKEGSGCF